MSALALDLLPAPLDAPGREDPLASVRPAVALAPLTPTGGRPTLDEILAGVWEGLAADRTVSCPACGGAMAPRSRSGPGPVGGRCTDCGSTLD